MRVNINFQFTIERSKTEPPEQPHPNGDNYAATTLSGPQRVGFTIDMPNHE